MPYCCLILVHYNVEIGVTTTMIITMMVRLMMMAMMMTFMWMIMIKVNKESGDNNCSTPFFRLLHYYDRKVEKKNVRATPLILWGKSQLQFTCDTLSRQPIPGLNKNLPTKNIYSYIYLSPNSFIHSVIFIKLLARQWNIHYVTLMWALPWKRN